MDWRARCVKLSSVNRHSLQTLEAAMHDEDDFLRKLLENPADDTTRMVYADWLDERDDSESKAKAKFLRVTVRLMGPIQRHGWRSARKKELQRLAATLPTDWLAVVSRVRVENCAAKRAEDMQREVPMLTVYVCDKRWDEMHATADVAVRFCERCERNVHYCDTILVARDHAQQGHCIAVDLGIIRRDNDTGLVMIT